VKSIPFAGWRTPNDLEERLNRNVEYMLLGLGAAWLIMFTYVVLITLRERKLRKELDRVRRMVEHPQK
jgi:K+-sensing histidine kinase KdpD